MKHTKNGYDIEGWKFRRLKIKGLDDVFRILITLFFNHLKYILSEFIPDQIITFYTLHFRFQWFYS